MNEQNLKKNMLWNAAGNLIYLMCQWIVTVLVTNIGAFRDAGLLSVAMSVSATFQTVAMFGIRNYQVSDVENKYSDTCYAFFRIITCAVALVACIAFSLICGYGGEQMLAITLFMLFRLAENFSDVLHGIAQKRGRLDIAGKAFAIKGIGLVVVFLAAYRWSGQLCAGLFAMAAFSIGSTILYDLVAVRRLSAFGLVSCERDWLALAKETAPLCLYLFFSAAISTVPKLILERQCGEEILGAYSSIFAPALLIQAAMGYIYNPFAQMLGEKKVKSDRVGFLKLSGLLMAAITLIALLMVIVANFLGEGLLALIFGDAIRPYAYLLIPILIAVSVTAWFAFLCMLAIVLRSFAWLLISCGFGFVFCVAFTKPFITHFSVNGTSYSLIAATVLASLILIVGIAFSLLPKNNKK